MVATTTGNREHRFAAEFHTGANLIPMTYRSSLIVHRLAIAYAIRQLTISGIIDREIGKTEIVRLASR